MCKGWRRKKKEKERMKNKGKESKGGKKCKKADF